MSTTVKLGNRTVKVEDFTEVVAHKRIESTDTLIDVKKQLIELMVDDFRRRLESENNICEYMMKTPDVVSISVIYLNQY